MGHAYISHRLVPQQALLQYLTFHELVALLKFSQYVFAQANRAQHRLLWCAARKLRLRAALQLPHALAPLAPARRAIALQWWAPAYGRHWPALPGHDRQAPQVGIVSTVGTLADALSQGNHDLYISEIGDGQTGLGRSDIAVFALLSNTWPEAGEPEMHVLVDIRELMTGIVLPDDAPPRFQALVRKVVQEHLWIPVDTLARSSLTEGCLDPGHSMPQGAAG